MQYCLQHRRGMFPFRPPFPPFPPPPLCFFLFFTQ
jgi:hypothetical protein